MERVPEEKDLFDITIIGAGPTGLFGAFYAGMRELKTKVIDALPELGGQLTALYPEKYIYDTPGHPKVLAKELVKLLHEQALLFPPTFCLDEQIVGFEKLEDGTFLLRSKETVHRSKVVIVCAGIGAFSPNRHAAPGVAGLEGKRVHYKVKEKNLFRGKRLLIIGGGDSAVDWALNLRDVAATITLIHRREGFRAHESSLAEIEKSRNVEILRHFELKEIKLGKSDTIEKVVIFDNRDQAVRNLEIDEVLVFIGYKADLGPIKEWGIGTIGRQIAVNGMMETSVPGVYAAGDIAHDGHAVHLNLICVGYAQAAVAVNKAAHYLNPKATVYPGHSSEMKL